MIFNIIVLLVVVFPFCLGDNVCTIPGKCSQYCTPHNDSTFSCSCAKGYAEDANDRTKCKVEKGELSFIVADFTNIFQHTPSKKNSTLVVQNPSGVVNINFDIRSKLIFWTDTQERKIYSASLEKPASSDINSTTEVISEGIAESNGLAIDWIYKKLYWSDYALRIIQVCNYDGTMRKTIYTDNSDKPRAIAVDPNQGWIFWTSWGPIPKIMRSGADGSRKEIIAKENIIWPNDITLDLVLQQVYWIDPKLKTLSAASYDGTMRRLVMESEWIIAHPFSLTMFEDKLYWSDWFRKIVVETSKFGGNDICTHNIQSVPRPRSVGTFHESRQPIETNYCGTNNGQCSHHCLPSPNYKASTQKFICACPDGMELETDEKTCKDIPLESSSSGFASGVQHVTDWTMEATESHVDPVSTVLSSSSTTMVPSTGSRDGSTVSENLIKENTPVVVPVNKISSRHVNNYDEAISLTPETSAVIHKSSEESSSNAGAVVGITIGVLVVLGTLLGAIVIFLRRRGFGVIPKTLLDSDYCAELDDSSSVSWRTTSFTVPRR